MIAPYFYGVYMRDENVSNGFYIIIALCIFALGFTFFNLMSYVGFRNIKQARAEVDDKQLAQMGEYHLEEPVLTGADVIFSIESAYDSGLDIYINGSFVNSAYIKRAKANATVYNGAPFNITRHSNYTKEYLFDNETVIGVNFKTH